jgi:hypothetical protein
MLTEPTNTEEVRILNSQTGTFGTFRLRRDRLESFLAFLVKTLVMVPEKAAMPGVSGPAHFALDCIFFGPKPPRFPAADVLGFLRDRQKSTAYTTAQIEHALGLWAGTVKQLLADGSER